jgi:4-diphosphocytidyl-2-C-methyl-D-erythritol kinase
MEVALESPCKVNFILNILGKRPDGFHELETLMHPVRVCDTIHLARQGGAIELSCSNPQLPTDSGNLVYRAAEQFLRTARIEEGVRIYLEKRIPLAAGLGGGSGNAATTLLGLNRLFDSALLPDQLNEIAGSLGSDIPFFLQDKPAIAVGRGEQVRPIESFATLGGWEILLIHPGFGVSTPWAYKNLGRFPDALNGQSGRAERLAGRLRHSVAEASPEFYNSLEAPVLEKYPLLLIYQEFLRENGAALALMSGSGSTTFALIESAKRSQIIQERFRSNFGETAWVSSVPLLTAI